MIYRSYFLSCDCFISYITELLGDFISTHYATILVVLTPFLFIYSSDVYWIYIGRNPGSRIYAKETTFLPSILDSKGNWLIFSILDSTIILVTIEIWMEGVVWRLHSRTIMLVGPILHMVFVGRLWGRMVLVILYWPRGFYSEDICYLLCLGRHSARATKWCWFCLLGG